ncbi:MAG: hypothetical protein LIO96_03200 [Lachnospiraceae bacterium]|nr:hypothetical protein [Lachnospiraceae bacterium]
MRQNAAGALKMPANYVAMSEEEMSCVEGGATYYNTSKCKTKAAEALRLFNIYSNNIQNADWGNCPGSYLGYAIVLNKYYYQYTQYTAGSRKKGVDYYNARKIVVR